MSKTTDELIRDIDRLDAIHREVLHHQEVVLATVESIVMEWTTSEREESWRK